MNPSIINFKIRKLSSLMIPFALLEVSYNAGVNGQWCGVEWQCRCSSSILHLGMDFHRHQSRMFGSNEMPYGPAGPFRRPPMVIVIGCVTDGNCHADCQETPRASINGHSY